MRQIQSSSTNYTAKRTIVLFFIESDTNALLPTHFVCVTSDFQPFLTYGIIGTQIVWRPFELNCTMSHYIHALRDR
jgi:hypothetical protein